MFRVGFRLLQTPRTDCSCTITLPFDVRRQKVIPARNYEFSISVDILQNQSAENKDNSFHYSVITDYSLLPASYPGAHN